MTTGGGRERPAGEKIEEVWTTIAARNMLRSFELIAVTTRSVEERKDRPKDKQEKI
jgi:hypothetical protein